MGCRAELSITPGHGQGFIAQRSRLLPLTRRSETLSGGREQRDDHILAACCTHSVNLEHGSGVIVQLLKTPALKVVHVGVATSPMTDPAGVICSCARVLVMRFLYSCPLIRLSVCTDFDRFSHLYAHTRPVSVSVDLILVLIACSKYLIED